MAVDENSCVHGAGHSMLVREMASRAVAGDGVAPSARGLEGSPLSWFQERLWVHYERDPKSTSYNLPLMLLVRGNLDASALERSLSEIVARHGSLRTVYGETEKGDPVQVVAPPECVRLPVIAVDRAQMLEHLERNLEHRFDLRRGPIFIASLLRLSEDKHLLLLNVHHIAADAW